MTEDTLAPITDAIVVNAPVDAVWRTLTSTETAPHWLGCMRYERRIGAVFFMQQDPAKAAADDVSGATHCEVLTLDAPTHFRFSWFVPGLPETFVDFRLESLGPATTQVLFTHEGWDRLPIEMVRPFHAALTGGWRGFVLPNLKRAAEAAH